MLEHCYLPEQTGPPEHEFDFVSVWKWLLWTSQEWLEMINQDLRKHLIVYYLWASISSNELKDSTFPKVPGSVTYIGCRVDADFLSCEQAAGQGSGCQFSTNTATGYFTPSFLETWHSCKQQEGGEQKFSLVPWRGGKDEWRREKRGGKKEAITRRSDGIWICHHEPYDTIL